MSEKSVNSLTNSLQRSYLPIWIKLAAVALVIGLGYKVCSEWNVYVAATIEWQKALHGMLAGHIRAVSQDALIYGGALIALSFGYGAFHAIGPGHGKAVIVTYLGTNKQSLRKGIIISLAASILQSSIAIVLVSGLARVLNFQLSEVHNYGNTMALVSFILVMLLGFMLIFGSLRRMYLFSRSNMQTERDHLHSHSHSHSHDHHDHHDHHDQRSNCGCSHTHVPEQDESFWHTLTVILSMGIRPCSGAIVVLIYAHLVGVYEYGVLATLVMGLGTGLSISLIALSTLFIRSKLERIVMPSEEGRVQTVSTAIAAASNYLRLVGGVLLFALGWSFYQTASVMSAGHPLF